MKVFTVSSNNYGITAQLLNAVHSMRQQNLIHFAAGVTHRNQMGTAWLLRIAPAAASAVQQVIADKPILKSVSGWFGKFAIVVTRYVLAAIRKIRERHAHQGHIPGCDFRAPHAITDRICPYQHVQVAVSAFEKRKLI